MKLQIHDTLRRDKVEFQPQNPQRVTLYVCGPTVYSYAHIGNARPVVVFDVLFRLLRTIYGEDHVIYARNITDVDDKINKAAMDQGVEIDVITNHFADIYNQDMATLGALRPTLEPRVTHNMAAIVDQIAAIVANGHAYAEQGHVLFDVESFKTYGALSRRSVDDMIAGARVEVAPYKRNPQDFVLWKPSKTGEPVWDSPWGPGRPGWHIECSAMIEANLGLPIDIHGGGHDLIFPHHENEIAQGLCAQHAHGHDSEYAHYWMHNGFLTFDGDKMSKSLGNVKLVHDLIKQVPGEVIRAALLSAHYRGPLDWTGELIAQTQSRLDGMYGTLRKFAAVPVRDEATPPAVLEALSDDLNTPRAFAELSALAKALETAADDAARIAAKSQLLAAGKVLGLLQGDAEAWFKAGVDEDLTVKIDALIAERIAARTAKNWSEADRIRKALDELGVEVMDSATGATWKLKAGV
ncbi:cysteinyl-tRNA synthetase [Asticcacaulis biprosthecium C19]|uniref:Cysteine--tRNA ligase n=1 Tax=Asticcacaulis biprosthecium C19 TaxID=715226 RepID=F4QM93_9CAUL|nr:cysteine--tRNA ligase [Asticcacaulis biprosthecium]EGF91334.1 cysteinyl-tRNA synthetase [Asticcacaulis biprosthecium C19]